MLRRYLPPCVLLHGSIVASCSFTLNLFGQHVPNILSVHKLTARLAKRLNVSYGVFTPECNAAPLLWRLMKSMGGTRWFSFPQSTELDGTQ